MKSFNMAIYNRTNNKNGNFFSIRRITRKTAASNSKITLEKK